MTPIAQRLNRRLKAWRPETARKVERLVAEIITQTDAERRQHAPSRHNGRARRVDPLFADTAVFRGKAPKDTATHHDRYLYGPAS